MKSHRPQKIAIFAEALALVAAAFLFLPAMSLVSAAQETSTTSVQQSFATPELAVEALASSARSGEDSVLAVLGPDARRIAHSGDPVADQAARDRFSSAFAEGHRVEQDAEGRTILIIGKDEYPFPIPIVKDGSSWRFDTQAGEEEILNRRIGENELRVIETMNAYVEAQRDYALEDRDGRGPQYARRLLSQEGQKDGLYWPSSDDENESPLGPLFASAQSAGYVGSSSPDSNPRPYYGYLYRILTSQGDAARGGARDYVVNDRMIGGFGLIAIPAEYGNSGVMTFVINNDGLVFEKDLGPDTAKLADEITSFNPDSSWTKAEQPKEE